jgi:hypothetical protein
MAMYPPKVVFPDFSCGLHAAEAIRPEYALFVTLTAPCTSVLDPKAILLNRPPCSPVYGLKGRRRLIHFWTDLPVK